ncbi:unnamed protein product, partial [marine sediment metagenome]
MAGDYIAFGDLVLNGTGAVGSTGASYTVERATGLGSLPQPRITISQLAGSPGSVLSEADDDVRLVNLEGEIHAPTHDLLIEELPRFKYNLSTQRGEQWLYWTPDSQAARRIKAVLQNDGAVLLDKDDDCTAVFNLSFLCHSPYWESTTQTTTTTAITGTGQTFDLVNLGDVYTEPVIRITPTSAKGAGGGFPYKRWVALYNRLSDAMTEYPIQITSQDGVSGLNHATLVSSGKSLTGGGDLQ